MNRFAIASLLLAMIASTASAQYRWVDKDGRTGFGDNPPRDAKSVQRLDMRGGESSDASKEFPFELKRAVDRFPVTLYSATACEPCDLARNFLRSRGIPYSERTIANENDAEELKRISGGIRLPVMTVGRQVQVPFDPEIWTSTLDAASYPRGSMLPRSYQPPAPQPLTARASEAAPAKRAEPAKASAEATNPAAAAAVSRQQ
jgi:glutaredoxin